MICRAFTPMHHVTIVVSSARAGGGLAGGGGGDPEHGYDLNYIWKQVDLGPVKDAAGYYLQASEALGEPPGRWWGPGAKALGLEPGQVVDREPYDLLFGQRRPPMAPRWAAAGKPWTCTLGCWLGGPAHPKNSVTTPTRPRGGVRRGDLSVQSRALTYLMVTGRMRGDVEGVRKAIGPVIERAREAALPEYEAMAIANRAWLAWRSGDEEKAAADAQAALRIWEEVPFRYVFDWMALWPLVAIALAAQRVEQAAEYARGMLPPPQQSLPEPARTLIEDAVRAWDAGQPAGTEELLHRAVRAAADLGYL
jgi:hypothetical protein